MHIYIYIYRVFDIAVLECAFVMKVIYISLGIKSLFNIS